MTLRKKSAGLREDGVGEGWAIGPGSRMRPSCQSRTGVRGWVDENVRGCIWWARAPLLLWMTWVWYRHASDSDYQSLLKGLNLGIHELGHIVFGFGESMGIAGGTILQLLAPLVAMGMFLRQRDPFAIAFAFGWLGTSFMDVAVYAGDARSMDLPLVSPFAGDEIIHDWNWMLSRLGWLSSDMTISGIFRLLGHASFAVCLVGGSWVLARMGSTKDDQSFRPLK